MQTHRFTGKFVLIALWQASPGQEQAVAEILHQLCAETRKELGCQAFLIHREEGDPSQFQLFEVYDDAAAFAVHQETPHFKSLVLEQAVPLLAKRERIRCLPI